MEEKRTTLKLLRKERFDYIFEDVETKEEIKLKVWKDKDFINELEDGVEGMAEYNDTWLNKWESTQTDSKPKAESKPIVHDGSIESIESQLTPIQKNSLGVIRGNANSCAAQIMSGSEWDKDKFEQISNDIYLLALKRLVK